MTTLYRVRTGMTAKQASGGFCARCPGQLVNRSPHAEYDGSPLVDIVRYSFDVCEPLLSALLNRIASDRQAPSATGSCLPAALDSPS